jgi:hypothetical protein
VAIQQEYLVVSSQVEEVGNQVAIQQEYLEVSIQAALEEAYLLTLEATILLAVSSSLEE